MPLYCYAVLLTALESDNTKTARGINTIFGLMNVMSTLQFHCRLHLFFAYQNQTLTSLCKIESFLTDLGS